MNVDSGEVLHRYSSGVVAGSILGIDNSAISRVCRGLQKSVAGFKWSFYTGTEPGSLASNLFDEGSFHSHPLAVVLADNQRDSIQLAIAKEVSLLSVNAQS